MKTPNTILWFRHDLRLHDNPALDAALYLRHPIVPVFLWTPEEEAPWPPGAASRWWLHHSLVSLAADLENRGSRLLVRRGPSAESLLDLARTSGADTLIFNERYEPAVVARDAGVADALESSGLHVETRQAALLADPRAIHTRQGRPFRVFTPFWNALRKDPAIAQSIDETPADPPAQLPAPKRWPASLSIEDLGLLPEFDWTSGLRAAWRPGESGARDSLERFLDDALFDYPQNRDRPDCSATSRLSPHLHFGEISPRTVWRTVRFRAAVEARSETAYLRQLAWREFAYHLLVHFPDTPNLPLRPEFRKFPWRNAPDDCAAWRRGRTGYPLIDAGMRQLRSTGWMHNRVRMIAASFLVKDLLVPWQTGARFFWETLVDADLANNTLGWQWVAGCGADAAPYFRIFNPTTQGERFDPQGDYVRRWIPELAGLPGVGIHRPGNATDRGDIAYPDPIADHQATRSRALDAYAALRASRDPAPKGKRNRIEPKKKKKGNPA